jgi:hypothetical protein
MSKTTDDIPASPLAPLMVQLLYDSPPAIDFTQLTAKVEQYCGRTDPRTRPAQDAKMAHYFMLDAMAQFKEKSLPTQLCLCRADSPPDAARLEAALQQTWDWEEAGNAIESAKHVLLANDLMAASLQPEVRNRQFRGFVRAVHEVAPCVAMHWMNSQLLVHPDRFVYRQGESQAGPLYGSINVRFFNIEGTKGDQLMDTLGLAVLGLPDIQCHYRGLDPRDVARIMYDVAYYLFQSGDVIKDGETVPGVLEHDKWRCQHEMSLLGPERVVLDLNPGENYAAGTRTAKAD